MNLKLNYEGYEQNLVYTNRLLNGIQYVFKFENDYGASVIKHDGSYGHRDDLWELAVAKFGDADKRDWHLDYDTEITDDVIGSLTDEEVRNLLARIKEL